MGFGMLFVWVDKLGFVGGKECFATAVASFFCPATKETKNAPTQKGRNIKDVLILPFAVGGLSL